MESIWLLYLTQEKANTECNKTGGQWAEPEYFNNCIVDGIQYFYGFEKPPMPSAYWPSEGLESDKEAEFQPEWRGIQEI